MGGRPPHAIHLLRCDIFLFPTFIKPYWILVVMNSSEKYVTVVDSSLGGHTMIAEEVIGYLQYEG